MLSGEECDWMGNECGGLMLGDGEECDDGMQSVVGWMGNECGVEVITSWTTMTRRSRGRGGTHRGEASASTAIH